MATIKVVVNGALGKVGQVLINAMSSGTEVQLVGAADVKAARDYLPLPDGSGQIPLSKDLGAILDSCKPDVVVDFTVAAAVMASARTAAERGVNMVIGTTGLSAEERDELTKLAEKNKTGIVLAPNFEANPW